MNLYVKQKSFLVRSSSSCKKFSFEYHVLMVKVLYVVRLCHKKYRVTYQGVKCQFKFIDNKYKVERFILRIKKKEKVKH